MYFPSPVLRGQHSPAAFAGSCDKKLNGKEAKKKPQPLSFHWFSRSYRAGRWVEIKRLSLSGTQDQLNRLRINLSPAVI